MREPVWKKKRQKISCSVAKYTFDSFQQNDRVVTSDIAFVSGKEKRENRDLLSATKGRSGWYPIPTPHIQEEKYIHDVQP